MRIIIRCLAWFQGINGLVMLGFPAYWYTVVPGVISTGPLNVHFVRDTGLGFLAAAAALLFFANNGDKKLIWTALIFLTGHAMLHLVDMLMQGVIDMTILRDLVIIVLPGVLPLWFIVRRDRQMVHR